MHNFKKLMSKPKLYAQTSSDFSPWQYVTYIFMEPSSLLSFIQSHIRGGFDCF